MKDKKYYIDLYNNYYNKSKQDWIKQGNDIEYFEFNSYNPEVIVGYYCSQYNDNALIQWKENLRYCENISDIDLKVSKILKDIY